MKKNKLKALNVMLPTRPDKGNEIECVAAFQTERVGAEDLPPNKGRVPFTATLDTSIAQLYAAGHAAVRVHFKAQNISLVK